MHLFITVLTGIFTPVNLLLMLGGTFFGMAMGALPGLTATMSVALLVPFTFTMNPISGLITLGAIYGGAIYGGAYPAILINTPGTPSSIGTTFDGFPMARKGQGARAIVGATIVSVFGGIFGTLVLLFLSPPLARASLSFGPTEYFWLAIFGLTIIASLASKSLLKGLTGGFFGLLVSTVGISPIGGDSRYTFGMPAMQGGIELIVALIGFFCIPEVLKMVGEGKKTMLTIDVKMEHGVFWRTVKDILRMPGNVIRSAVIGTIVGIVPGAGGNIANLVSYNEAKRASKHPERFGTGVLEGVVATECANNATVGGGMVPLLTLGIPGTPVDAVILGALMLQGLIPGAELFTKHGDVTYTFIVSMIFANLLMLGVGMFGGRSMHRVASRLSIRFLAPSILLLTILGSFAIRNNLFDVYAMIGAGLLGYLFRQFGFHPGPVVLGLILGPIAERGLVQSMLMSGSMAHPWTIFFVHPISLILIVLSIASALLSLLAKRRKSISSQLYSEEEDGSSPPANPTATTDSLSPSASGEAAAKPHNVDRYAAVFMLAFVALFASQSSGFSKYGTIFPVAVMGLLALVAVGLLVVSFVRPRRQPMFVHNEGSKVLVIAIAAVVWIVLIGVIGFVVTSIVALFALSIYLNPERRHISIPRHLLTLVSLVVEVVVFYLVFSYLLDVPLPAGILI